ncbi:retrovirus-related pol polyprotein from transposon TNT 1-94 [Tanacetum coccineum]
MDKSSGGEESIQSIMDSFNSKMQNMGCNNMIYDNSDLNMMRDVTSTLLAAAQDDIWGNTTDIPNAWGDLNVHGTNVTGTKSFASVLTIESTKPKVNFRALYNKGKVEETDFVLPVENVLAARKKFANSLVGFFVGKTVAFPLVHNYVKNTWGKYGFQKLISDDDSVFYFKFTSVTGMEQVMEKGPWMIRNQPLLLNKWTLNLALSKDEVKKVPIWVNIHKIRTW